jgi:flagellar biosynthesis chaperone FliJ
MLMKQDTKRQLLKVDKEASAAREKAYQDYVMQYEMAVAKQQSEAWRKALDGVPDSLRMLLEINNTENVPEYSEKQKKQYNDAIKAYDHTGNGVSWSHGKRFLTKLVERMKESGRKKNWIRDI